MNETDELLASLKEQHRRVARYTIYLRPANFAKGREVIESGLQYEVASTRRDELNAELAPRRFGDKMYCIELER